MLSEQGHDRREPQEQMREAPHIPELEQDPQADFPNPEHCRHPDGLIAWGGDLTSSRLINAYTQGIFPWYEPGSPILWWSPDPRAVFFPNHYKPAKRLIRTLQKPGWAVSVDEQFESVITACGEPRGTETGTWITPVMKKAYIELFQLGHAHSIEIWFEDTLVGGLYGVGLGPVFFAESKFHRRSDASKIALAYLMVLMRRWSFRLVDCQINNPHLTRLGAQLITRKAFRQQVLEGLQCAQPHPQHRPGRWRNDWPGLDQVDWRFESTPQTD